MIVGSIVLAGGQSTRMGFPKAWLPFGPLPVLGLVVQELLRYTNPLVVVRGSADQVLPPLQPEVDVIDDDRPGRGPLEGIRAGLRALRPHCDAAFVSGCDSPFVSGSYIDFLASQMAGHDIVVPFVGGAQQTLAALYSIAVLPKVEELLQQDQLKPATLFERVRTRKLTEADVRSVDPDLRVLTAMNTPEEYQAALKRAGLPAVPVPKTVPGGG